MFSGIFETEIPIADLLLRMGLALAFGGCIGFEREMKQRPAGLRTNMMVALAAATFTLIGAELISEAVEHDGVMRMDSLRIIEAVIAGVAFLGAGTIIRGGDQVYGLTTGASLWMSGAIGVACGGGYFVIAGVGAALSLVVLHMLRLLEPDRHDGKKPESGKN